VTWVAGLVLVAGVVQSFAGAVQVGVTWDEPNHVERTASLLTTGWYLLPAELVDGEPDGSSPFVYGPTYSLTAHAVNRVLGDEPPGGAAHTAAAYRNRHLAVAALGLLGILAVGLMTWTLTGSRRFGLLGAAILAALPPWTGHSMFNVKDVPAAVGTTLLTAGLVLALTPVDRGPSRPLRHVLVPSLVALGVFFGVGTRPALWVPLAASVASYVLLLLLARRADDAGWPGGIAAVATGLVVGTAATALAYPNAFATPLQLLVRSVVESSAFPWAGVTLTAGQWLVARDLPWWYLPAWFGAQLPLLLGALAIVGIAVTAIAVVRRSPGQRWWRVPAPAGGALLVTQQALLLPLASIVTGSVMYDGLRQHLYAIPALAVLSTLGVARLWRAARHHGDGRPWLRPVLAVGVGLALVVPTVEQALLFPYNYAYVNAVAGIGGVNDRWETDYWKASGREAVRRVPPEVELACSALYRPRLDETADPRPCGRDVTTYEHLRGTAVRTDLDPSWKDPEATRWLIGVKREGNRPPPSCEEAGSPTRWLRGERVVMGLVVACDRDAD
jgi:hypothetical protein